MRWRVIYHMATILFSAGLFLIQPVTMIDFKKAAVALRTFLRCASQAARRRGKIKNQENAGRAFHLQRGIGVMIYRSIALDDRFIARADFIDVLRVPHGAK